MKAGYVMLEEKIMWWGYIHNSGTVHAKRYFTKQDIDEAHESPFVKEVFGPIEGTRDDIIRIMDKDSKFPYT